MQIELNPLLSDADAIKIAKKFKKCSAHCNHQGLDVPSFVSCIANQDFEKAADILYEHNPFPAITGRLGASCHHLCKNVVSLRSLQRFVGDNFLPQLKKKGRSKKTVAIIGTGISGIVSANYFIEHGYQVTMIEVRQQAGGFLQNSVAEFRLPPAVLEAELSRILPHVTIKYDTPAGTLHGIETLSKKYDVIMIATGASKPVFDLSGEHLPNVFTAQEYAHVDTQGLSNAVIIGGTDNALESALLARSKGAEALIVYKQQIEEMPVDPELLKASLAAGVQFLLLTKPLRIVGKEKVESLECLQMRLSEDFGGMREVMPIDESEFQTECDHVVIAKGYDAHPSMAINTMLRQSGKQKLWTNSKGQTTIENVYACGGIVLGFKPVAEIIQHAKTTTLSACEFLKQKK